MGEEFDDEGKLQWGDPMESRNLDVGEILESPREVNSTTLRFLRFPNPTAVNAECELLDSPEAKTGRPASDGTPYKVEEFEWISR